MELADRVRQRREVLGMSQEDLAMKMGYTSRSSINKIENGRPCSQKIIARLADALNVSIPYLMGWETDSQYEQKKETPDEEAEVSENLRLLIDFAKSVPEDKAEMILRVIKSILGDEK